MKRICTYVLLSAFLFLGKMGFSQITLSQTTVNNYVANICGPGVTFSNVSLTGDARAIASFIGGTSAGLGASMNSGIVLSTGLVNTATALQGGPGVHLSTNNNGPSIPQLNGIAGDDTYDGIILEFDFVPITNSINVNYIFGSEEYNEYVGMGYNDAFAFYISGPGIAGTPNIAVLPGNIPVTIDNINLSSNSSLYRNNIALNNPNVMDGYTAQLTASSAVIACQTYHIRLMIADGGDDIYDSWVFIQENGLFAVGNPPLSLAATYPFGTALYEECFNTNTITFTIPTAQASDYSFNVTWGGTATSGVDYSPLPTSITIPAGQTSVNLPINVFTDGVTEGVETIECTYPISVCSNGVAVINIDDAVPLTVNAGPDTDICGGGSAATLTATSANGNGAVTYSWDNGAGTTASVSVQPATTTAYTVTATDQCGRTATDQVNVAVGPLPVVDAGTNASICPGASATLSANGAVTYTWDNGLGAGNNVSVSPAATTTYNVTGTDANGCSNTDQVTITVNSLPAVDAGSDQTICQGAAISVSGLGAVTYSWSNGVSNGVSFNPSSTQTYTVTGTDANGCTNTDQVTINVNPLPAVDAGSPQTVCQGGTIVLNGSGAQAYSWNNSVSNGVSFIPSTTQTYTVTGTDANGCVNTDQVLVTVNALPVIGAGADQAVCQGGPVTLSGTGGVSYTWNNGVTNSNPFTPAATQTYTVTGTDANGCQGTDEVTITVNPLPVVDAGASQSVCHGAMVTLNGSGAASYAWNNGGSNGVPFACASTQTYTVTGTDANGCVNTDQVTITVNPLPAVNAGVDQAVCAGVSVTLNGSGATSYSWNNGVTNGVVFTPGSTQTYTVTGTDANGCQGTDQVTVVVNAPPVVNAGPDEVICVGSSVTLSGSGALTYSWSNGISDGIAFAPGSTTTYIVTGTDANGCVNSDQVTVTVVSFPVASVSSDVNAGYTPLTVNFDNNSSNATSYHWDFGNGTQHTTSSTGGQQAEYTVPGEYTVILTAANGSCTDTDTLKIIVDPLPDPEFRIPNIFTPNGDKNNDTFFITVSYVKSVKVEIVNRWGDKMCIYDDVNGYWDGNVNGDIASDGVYFFTYVIEGINGKVVSGHGNIQLIR